MDKEKFVQNVKYFCGKKALNRLLHSRKAAREKTSSENF